MCSLETNLSDFDIGVDLLITIETTQHIKIWGKGVFIKEHLFNYIDVLKCECSYIVWLKIKYQSMKAIGRSIVLTPVGFKYFDENKFLLVKQKLNVTTNTLA